MYSIGRKSLPCQHWNCWVSPVLQTIGDHQQGRQQRTRSSPAQRQPEAPFQSRSSREWIHQKSPSTETGMIERRPTGQVSSSRCIPWNRVESHRIPLGYLWLPPWLESLWVHSRLRTWEECLRKRFWIKSLLSWLITSTIWIGTEGKIADWLGMKRVQVLPKWGSKL